MDGEYESPGRRTRLDFAWGSPHGVAWGGDGWLVAFELARAPESRTAPYLAREMG